MGTHILKGLLPLLTIGVAGCDRGATGVDARAPVESVLSLQPVEAASVQFQTDSSSVFGSGCWGDATVRGCVTAIRSHEGASRRTFLFYSVESCVPSDSTPGDTMPPDTMPGDTLPPPPVCTAVEVGYGYIPNGDLTGSGIRSLHLATNTSAAANPQFVRVVGSGGDVTLDWARSGAFSLRSNCTTQYAFGGFTLQVTGVSWSFDDFLSGSLVGYPVVNQTFAQVSRVQQLILQRGP